MSSISCNVVFVNGRSTNDDEHLNCSQSDLRFKLSRTSLQPSFSFLHRQHIPTYLQSAVISTFFDTTLYSNNKMWVSMIGND